jgi:hypothetical protein
VTFNGPLTNTSMGSDIFQGSITAECNFTFLNTNLEDEINTDLLDQIKLITNDTQISIYPPQPSNITSGPELLSFLNTNTYEYGYIINNISVTENLINTSGIQKTLMNITGTPITITKI